MKRSRTSTAVLTVNGEVHIHEEAQVFVHDPNLFITVQFFEETPAVVSPGKVCEDHGYSHELVSGQKPRLPKMERVLSARQTISYLSSFQGLCTNPESVSSSTSPSEDSLRRDAEIASDDSMRLASSSSSGSVFERREEK